MPDTASDFAKKEKAAAYQAAYYQKNRTKIIERTKARSMERYWSDRETALAVNKAYREANADKIKARKAKQRAETKAQRAAYSTIYHAQNRARRLANAREWHAANRERVAERHSAWSKENSAACAARTRARDAAKLRAMPHWADQGRIKAIYVEAARISRETGIPHHVDHIVPLKSKIVCGLHCEANLRIITAAENLAKHNQWPLRSA